MNFSTDRDLLAYEPSLFTDVPLVAQQRLSVTDAEVTGTTAFSVSADFEAAQVEAGCVVLIDRRPFEVVTRTDEATLTVSLPRTRTADAAIPAAARAPPPTTASLTPRCCRERTDPRPDRFTPRPARVAACVLSPR